MARRGLAMAAPKPEKLEKAEKHEKHRVMELPISEPVLSLVFHRFKPLGIYGETRPGHSCPVSGGFLWFSLFFLNICLVGTEGSQEGVFQEL